MSEKIGRYEIRAELGRGGMATVYRAFDPHFKREVAVKVLPQQFMHDPQFRARFDREAEIIAALEHPAIVPVYDFGEEKEQPYIVMRFMAGGSLADRLTKGPLSLTDSARLFSRIAPALDRAHAKGVVHRDLKPGNILFDDEDNPYISDFGIAKLTEGTQVFTNTGGIVGTPAYMSPEQARGERNIDGRSDIYAMGAIVFEMLTGKLPYEADTPMGLAVKHITEPTPNIRDLRPNLPTQCDTVIHTAMAKKKEERYLTAHQLAEALTMTATGAGGQQAERSPTMPMHGGTIPIRPPTPLPPNRQQPATYNDYAPTFGGPTGARATGTPPAPSGKSSGARLGLIIGATLLLLVCAITAVGGAVMGPTLMRGFEQGLQTAQAGTSIGLITATPTSQAQPTSTPGPQATQTDAAVVIEFVPQPIQFATLAPSDNLKFVTGSICCDTGPVISIFGADPALTQLTLVGLAEYDEAGKLVPELAESWTVSDDGLTVTWTLRPNIFWSDGEPITAADVKFTWEAIMEPSNNATTGGYELIGSVAVIDDLTVRLNFNEPYVFWEDLFTGPGGVILPEHVLAGQTNLTAGEYARQPNVVSGPYLIVERVDGDHMTLIANPNFYKGRPNIDQITLQVILDSETAKAALIAEEIDWYDGFNEAEAAGLSALEPNIQVLTPPLPYADLYLFNLGQTAGVNGEGRSDVEGFCPFKDEEVRRAIALGIDRQNIVDTLFNGKTSVAASMLTSSYWSSPGLEPIPYDPALASAILDELGYAPGADGIRTGVCDGREVRLAIEFYTSTSPVRTQMAELVTEHLRAIGVDFRVNAISAADLFAAYEQGGIIWTGAFDMIGFAWAGSPNPEMYSLWACSEVVNETNTATSNVARVCDPTLDTLLLEADSTHDPDRRKALHDEIQVYMQDHVIFLPMYTRFMVVGANRRVDLGAFSGSSDLYWRVETWDVN